MAIKNWIQSFLTRDNDKPIRGRLPHIQLFGTEKSYGAPAPHDYNRFIDSYRSWVYACAWKNAVSVAKVKLCLYKKTRMADGDIDLDKIYEHPFLDLINSVNPFTNRLEHFTITQINLELTGNAYWWIPKDVLGVPYMIWNMPSNWVKIVPSKEKFISGYVVQVPGKAEVVPFDETEIVHFKFPSPFSLFYGVGPTWGASYGIDLNTQMKEWGINFFQNNAQPSGILSTESSLSEDQYLRLRDRWNEKHKGSKNAGKMAILEEGLKYQQTGSTAREATIDVVSREIRDEIMAMYGTPASKLGLVEDVNRANADANDYTYQKETIIPRLMFIQEKINEKILPMYDKSLVCEFEDPVESDKEFMLKEKEINLRVGVSTIDEERIKEGLEPFNLPETSKPLIPFSVMPAGEERELATSDQYQEGEDEKEDEADDEKDEDKKSKSADKRLRKWETFVAATAPIEKRLGDIMQRYFESQHGEVIKNLNQYRTMKKDLNGIIFFNINEQNEKLKNLSKPSIKTAFTTGVTLASKETGHVIDFNLFNPNILRAVEQRMQLFVEKTNPTTAKLLEEALKESLQAGESVQEMSYRIDKIFNYSRDFRAKRIAQTEVIGATNDGKLKLYIEAGIEDKTWITARDERVRDSHLIDGQKVKTTELFTLANGTQLLYPGDRSTGAPAEDVINCRCTF